MKSGLKSIFQNIPRVLIGITFALSGIGKIINREDAVNLVEMFSDWISILSGIGNEIVILTILIELVLALLLFTKKNLLLVYIFSFLFVGIFTGVIGLLYFEGTSLSSCGCFGAFGFSGGLEITLSRNVVLLCLIVTGYLVNLSNDSTKEPK